VGSHQNTFSGSILIASGAVGSEIKWREIEGRAHDQSRRISIGPNLRPKEKAARRRLPNSNLMIADQAAINAGFDFRRYAMKPMPAKPRIIIAHVEGSGTAGATSGAIRPSIPCQSFTPITLISD
jgi:hypothetical protein